jgi:hypothetical protein
MEERLMTVERWNNPEVRARFYSGFTDAFIRVDTIQRDGTEDTHKPEQDNRPSR